MPKPLPVFPHPAVIVCLVYDVTGSCVNNPGRHTGRHTGRRTCCIETCLLLRKVRTDN